MVGAGEEGGVMVGEVFAGAVSGGWTDLCWYGGLSSSELVKPPS